MQVLKPPPGARSQLNAAHKHVDPRLVGTRRLTLTPNDLTIHQSGESPRADHALLLKHCDSSLPPPRGDTVLEAPGNECYFFSVLFNSIFGVLLVISVWRQLRFQQQCGMSSIPGQGTSICCGHSQRKKNQKGSSRRGAVVNESD